MMDLPNDISIPSLGSARARTAKAADLAIYTCEYNCGFKGQFDAVQAHELDCEKNPKRAEWRDSDDSDDCDGTTNATVTSGEEDEELERGLEFECGPKVRPWACIHATHAQPFTQLYSVNIQSFEFIMPRTLPCTR